MAKLAELWRLTRVPQCSLTLLLTMDLSEKSQTSATSAQQAKAVR
jgi:hypothetical protein